MPVNYDYNIKEYKFEKETNSLLKLSQNIQNLKIITGMATCHSITYIHSKLDGDPLDLKLFKFIDWKLVEPNNKEFNKFDTFISAMVQSDLKECEYIGIVKQFPFSSSLQRMSVVVRFFNKDYFEFFCKGSPEIIASMSKPATLPKNFNDILKKYTRNGYRVISIASKTLDASLDFKTLDTIDRRKLEQDLEFLGLIILENKLKPETSHVIKCLKTANIRLIMCTGDNLMTGISVSRECNLIDTNEDVFLIEMDNENQLVPKCTHLNLNEKEIDLNNKKFDTFSHFAVNGSTFEILKNKHYEWFKLLIKHGINF